MRIFSILATQEIPVRDARRCVGIGMISAAARIIKVAAEARDYLLKQSRKSKPRDRSEAEQIRISAIAER